MRKIISCVLILVSLLHFSVKAQDNWRYINSENINFKSPENWHIINSSKPKGAIRIKTYDPNSKQFVEIRGERIKINLKTRVNDIALARSKHENFEYMQIDNIQNVKFNDYQAELLNYTNIFLNDVYKGRIYSFIKEGYTYTVEFYGEDLPQIQNFLQQIVSSININSADKKENINNKEKQFVEDNWATMEIDNSAEILAKESAKAEELSRKETIKSIVKEKKVKEKVQQEIEKQQKRLEKEQEKWKKQQKKLEEKQQKLEKKLVEKEKQFIKTEKRRIEKENRIPELKNRNKKIEKQINDITEQQLRLGKEYGSAQLKNDQKKMGKIQKKQMKLMDEVTKLSKERSDIIKKLNDF